MPILVGCPGYMHLVYPNCFQFLLDTTVTPIENEIKDIFGRGVGGGGGNQHALEFACMCKIALAC